MTYVVNVNNTEVQFPYERPYQSQRIIMDTAIKSISAGQNALLESPTGTGKTLALLSGALALQRVDNSLNHIVYTSRTHTQLRQVIAEYKRLPYQEQMTILASRKRLCINKTAIDSVNIDLQCYILNHAKEDEERCGYHRKGKITEVPHMISPNGPLGKFDIEELYNYGKAAHTCPYYLAQDILPASKIVFSPYNYFLGPKAQKSLKITNYALIFDEAHNIENVSRGAVTFKSYFNMFDTIIASANRRYKKVTENNGKKPKNYTDPEVYKLIINLAANFKKFITTQWNYYLHHKNVDGNTHLAINYLKQILPDIQLASARLLEYSTADDDVNEAMINDPPELLIFASDLGYTLQNIDAKNANAFVYLFNPGDKLENSSFQINCLDPAVVFMSSTKAARSIILASGTLSPLESFESELGTTFQMKQSVPHVISPDQVNLYQIMGNQNDRMTSHYDYLEKNYKKVFAKFGRGVLEIAKETDGGVLVFVPSYTMRERMLAVWRYEGISDELCSMRAVFHEEQGRDMKEVISEYKQTNGRGILFAICKGSIGEGIDFSDQHARAVITFGIPYPPAKDQEIVQKINFNNQYRPNYRGQSWYFGQGMRTIMQTLGRVIRHSQDYGAIFLFEDRLKPLKNFPQWMTSNLKTVEYAYDCLDSYREFQRKMHEKFPNSFVPYEEPERKHITAREMRKMVQQQEKATKYQNIRPNPSNVFKQDYSHYPQTSYSQVPQNDIKPQIKNPPQNINLYQSNTQQQLQNDVKPQNFVSKIWNQLSSYLRPTQQETSTQNQRTSNYNSYQNQTPQKRDEEELIYREDEEDFQNQSNQKASNYNSQNKTPQREEYSYVDEPVQNKTKPVEVIELLSDDYSDDGKQLELPRPDQFEREVKPLPLDHVPTTLEMIRTSLMKNLVGESWWTDISTSKGFQELLKVDVFKFAFYDPDFVASLHDRSIRNLVKEGELPPTIPVFADEYGEIYGSQNTNPTSPNVRQLTNYRQESTPVQSKQETSYQSTPVKVKQEQTNQDFYDQRIKVKQESQNEYYDQKVKQEQIHFDQGNKEKQETSQISTPVKTNYDSNQSQTLQKSSTQTPVKKDENKSVIIYEKSLDDPPERYNSQQNSNQNFNSIVPPSYNYQQNYQPYNYNYQPYPNYYQQPNYYQNYPPYPNYNEQQNQSQQNYYNEQQNQSQQSDSAPSSQGKRYDLTICCLNCKAPVASIISIKRCEFKTPRKYRFMVLVGVSTPVHVFQVPASNMENIQFQNERAEFSASDQAAYSKALCSCGLCLGATVKAAARKGNEETDSTMFLASKIVVNICGKLLPLTSLSD